MRVFVTNMFSSLVDTAENQGTIGGDVNLSSRIVNQARHVTCDDCFRIHTLCNKDLQERKGKEKARFTLGKLPYQETLH